MNVPQAGAVQLAMAYAIYKSEKEKSLSLGNDKVAHCYIGCRVAKKISVRTTRYMGWYKEMQDITDCRKATHFEGRDYIATVSGAKAPGSSSDACVKYCQSTWGTP